MKRYYLFALSQKSEIYVKSRLHIFHVKLSASVGSKRRELLIKKCWRKQVFCTYCDIKRLQLYQVPFSMSKICRIKQPDVIFYLPRRTSNHNFANFVKHIFKILVTCNYIDILCSENSSAKLVTLKSPPYLLFSFFVIIIFFIIIIIVIIIVYNNASWLTTCFFCFQDCVFLVQYLNLVF